MILAAHEAFLFTKSVNQKVKELPNRIGEIASAIEKAARAGEVSICWREPIPTEYEFGRVRYSPTQSWPTDSDLRQLIDLGYGVDSWVQNIKGGPNQGSYKTIIVSWADIGSERDESEGEK